MTDQTPILNPAVEAMATALQNAVDAAERLPQGQPLLAEMLAAALDTVGGGAPSLTSFGDMRDDAAFWADIATPLEIEAYTAAGLKRIERTTFAPKARKRIFNALWNTFTPQEQARFVQAVVNGAKP